MIEITIAKSHYTGWEWRLTVDGHFKASGTLCNSPVHAAEECEKWISENCL